MDINYMERILLN